MRWTGREAATLRAALRMSIREFAARLGVNPRMVSKWEAAAAGITPRPVNQAALDTLWQQADDPAKARFEGALSGTIGKGHPPNDLDPSDDVKRQEFLRLAVSATAGAWVAHQFPEHDASDLVGAMAGPTASYRRLEGTVPTDRLVPVVDAHHQLAAGIVRDAMPTPAAYAILAETTGLAAWLAADQGRTGAARTHYATAVTQAERAGHPMLAAYMRASLGHYATETGDPRNGATLLRRARHALGDTAPAAARAWMAALHAVTFAALGDRKAALAELRTSEKLSDRAGDEPSRPFVFVFDNAKVARYGAATLAALGDVPAARVAYAAASPALTAPKARALAQVGHAQALADAGHVAEGCGLAAAALTVSRAYGSERVTQRVRAFRASLPHHTTDAADLDAGLARLYEDRG